MNAEVIHVVRMPGVSMKREVINVHALEEQKGNHTHWVVPSQEVRLNVAAILNAPVNSHVRMDNVIILVRPYRAENMLLVSQKTMLHGADVTVDSKRTLKANAHHNV